jgi:hypothetical protein
MLISLYTRISLDRPPLGPHSEDGRSDRVQLTGVGIHLENINERRGKYPQDFDLKIHERKARNFSHVDSDSPYSQQRSMPPVF